MRKVNYWNEETVCVELKIIAKELGHIPTAEYLKEIGRHDLMCAISRNGGWKHFSRTLNIPLKKSCTTTGWLGEDVVMDILRKKGFDVGLTPTRCHYDLIVNGCCRIDVKTAKYAEYGLSKGWFFRNGKQPSCDFVVLLRSDKNDCFIIPWSHCSNTNITVSKSMRKHKRWYEKYSLISKFCEINKIFHSFD